MQEKIVNNMANWMLWDLFFMGAIAVAAVVISCCLLYASNLPALPFRIWERVRNSVKDPTLASVPILCAGVFACYLAGIVSNSISDEWIDKSSYHHAFIKILWTNLNSKEDRIDDNTDNKIKVVVHKEIFHKYYENNEKPDYKNVIPDYFIANEYAMERRRVEELYSLFAKHYQHKQSHVFVLLSNPTLRGPANRDRST